MSKRLAAGVRKAFDLCKEIRAASPQPAAKFSGAPPPGQSAIDGNAIESILGVRAQGNDGMFRVVIASLSMARI